MKRRCGFAVVELPIVILVCGLAVLGLSFALYMATGKVPWIPTLLGGGFVILAIAMLIALGFWPSRPRK